MTFFYRVKWGNGTRSILTAITVLLVGLQAGHSLQINAVEGEHALIDLKGHTPEEGDLLIVRNPDGRKQGIVRIQKIIGNQALGRVARGQIGSGWRLEQYDRIAGKSVISNEAPKPTEVAAIPAPIAVEPLPAEPVAEQPVEELKPVDENPVQEPTEEERQVASADDSEAANEDEPFPQEHDPTLTTRDEGSGFTDALKRLRYGFLGAYNVYNQTVRVGTVTEEVAMAGSAFSAHGVGDWRLNPYFGFRHTLGIDQFFTSGSSTRANCTNSSVCNTSIVYGTLGTWAKVRYPDNKVSPWVGLGASLLTPISRTSSAIQNDTIGMILVGYASIGLDWNITETLTIPVQVDYGMWPKFTAISTSSLTIRAGLMF